MRAHHLLCIQGFQGHGYSPEYTANLAAIVARLRADPALPVEVRQSPDDVCVPCPFLRQAGCAAKGSGTEARVRARDEQVMRRLGLAESQTVAWADILARVASRIGEEDLPGICGDCDWLPYGMCTDGIRRLASSARQVGD